MTAKSPAPLLPIPGVNAPANYYGDADGLFDRETAKCVLCGMMIRHGAAQVAHIRTHVRAGLLGEEDGAIFYTLERVEE